MAEYGPEETWTMPEVPTSIQRLQSKALIIGDE